MADYKIQLGVHIKTSEIREQISKYNQNSNNAKLKLGIKLDTNDLKKQINQLNLGGNGKGVTIPINTQSLEKSLKDVKNIIADIQTTLGTLDNASGMKSLLSSVNQITTALGKVENESESLVKSLNTLRNRDFSVNIGVKLGGSNSVNNNIEASNVIRNQVIPELQKQEKALAQYLAKHYNTNEFNAINKLLSKTGNDIGGVGGVINTLDKFNQPIKKGELNQRMQDLRNYINLIKQAAATEGIDLTPVVSKFNGQADDMVKHVNDIKNGAQQAEDGFEKLKNLLGSGIDGEGLSKQLDSIVADLGEIKTVIQGLSQNNAIDSLTQSFNKLSDTLDKLMTNAKLVQDVLGSVGSGANAGMSNQAKNAQETAQAFKEVAQEAKKISNINIDISDGNINEIKNALKNLNVDDSDIEEATKELNELNIVAQNVSATFKNGQIAKVDIKGVETAVDGLKRAVVATTTFGDESAKTSIKFSQSFDKIAAEAQQIQARLKDTGAKGFAQEIQVAKDKARQFKDSTGELTAALKQLDTAMDTVKSASVYDADDISGAQRLVEANKEYAAALMNVNSQLDKLEYVQKQSNSSDALTAAKESALLRLKNLFEDNSEAAKRFAADVDRIQRELNECGNVAGVNVLNKQITNLGRQIKQTGLQTETFGSRIKQKFSKYLDYFSVASLFMYAEQGLRSMFEQVKLIDSAMTELKKVTNETDAAYEKFLTNAASRAREIGTTIDGLVSSTADFARLGYGFEDAQGLAEVANIYAVVGDEIQGVEGATESLISTMAAFKDEMNGMSNTDFAMSIIDKFNEIGNNFAISSGGIGEALERSASSLMAANNTIDESIALITAANTVVQDPEQVGKWLADIKSGYIG